MSTPSQRGRAAPEAELAPEITQVIDLVAEIMLAERRRQLTPERAPMTAGAEQDAA